jgi:subtilisin family serine protease
MGYKEEKIHNQEMPFITCREAIVSDAYEDLLVEYENNITAAMIQYEGFCYQIIDEKFAVIHRPFDLGRYERIEAIIPEVLPLLLGPYGISSMKQSGIIQMHQQPFLPLLGNDVIVGFIDSGIDYRHQAFRNENQMTRILSIWDQTIQEGVPPSNFQYGTEYTEIEINEALLSEDPFAIVPSVDETGHGTFAAGIASGSEIIRERFVGAAPESDIIMVKLKPAKRYLREIFYVNEDAIVYENIDVIMGAKYLVQKARQYGKPLVIYIGLGTNQGSHDGKFVLEEYLAKVGGLHGFVVVTAAGNEATLGHHYLGTYNPERPYEEVEIKVAPNEKGLIAQLWAQAPDLYSVAIISPTGEFIPRIPARLGKNEFTNLLLERTQIFVNYLMIEEKTGDQFVGILLSEPTAGLWTIRVYGDVVVSGIYNMWLDREGWSNPETQFIMPNPYTTVTLPGTSRMVITVGAYNHHDNSLFMPSGRGLTRQNINKPELVAPGVDVLGPFRDNELGRMSGTSVAAAHVAGAAALLLEWGIILRNSSHMNTLTVKKLLIRGAERKPQFDYPNREWGFGALDLFNTFEIIRGRE